MRRAALLGLITCMGCNQFWNIDPTKLEDPPDAPPDQPDVPRIKLTTQTAVTRTDTGGFDPVLLYDPISPPPAVQIGPVDGPLQAAVYKEDGTVEIPTEIFDLDQWRVVYTLDGAPDSAPREVHWHPPDTLQGHIVEPMFGRPERIPVPPGGGYSIVPPNLNVNFQHTNTRVFTTGLWTEGSFLAVPQGAALEYDFGGKAISMSGPLGAPERDKNDFGVLADYGFFGGAPNLCRVATGAAAFKVPTMMAGGRTAPDPQPTYVSASRDATLMAPVSMYGRLQSLLGARSSAALDVVRWRYGYAPSLGAFGFARPSTSVAGVLSLPAPQMIALTDCTFQQGDEILKTPLFADPVELRDRFPRIVHAEAVDTRTVNGIQLRSGFSAVVSSSTDVFPVDFGAAGATQIELYRGAVKIANLADDPDGVAILAGTEPLVLKFEVESAPAGLMADHFEITLYSLTSELTRQRIYTTAAKQLTIEPSFLLPETEYVFEIRSYRGRAGAANGDFKVNTYPQYATTVFSRTFKTP